MCLNFRLAKKQNALFSFFKNNSQLAHEQTEKEMCLNKTVKCEWAQKDFHLSLENIFSFIRKILIYSSVNDYLYIL